MAQVQERRTNALLRAPRDLRELRSLLSVLQVAIAVLALQLGDAGSTWALLAAGVASVIAFVRPLPDEASRATKRMWTLLVFVALSASLARAFSRAEFLAAGVDFLLLMVVQRFFNRQRTREHLQLLLLGAVLMTIASTVNAELNYPVLLAMYLPTVFLALIANHLVGEGERLGPRVSHQLTRRGTDDLGLLARAVRQVVWVAALSGLVVFVFFPRFGVGSFLQGQVKKDAVSGFGRSVQLGGFGRIKTDPTVVMRLRPQSELPPADRLDWHLRGIALDHYEAGRWERSELDTLGGEAAISPLRNMRGASSYQVFIDERGYAAGSTGGVQGMYARPRAGETRPGEVTRVEVHLEDIGSESLFIASEGLGVKLLPRGPLDRGVRVYANAQQQLILTRRTPGPVYYEFLSRLDGPSAVSLEGVGEPEVGPELEPFLQRADSLSSEFTDLARGLAEGADSRHAKVQAVLRFLDEGFVYSLEEARSQRVAAGADPIEGFVLETKSGHCEYFASAMALLLREMGVPARVVNGYYGGIYNELGGFYSVRQADAHSWVEVHFGELGWVTFDPTPPDGRIAGDGSQWWPGLSQAIDAIRNAYLVNIIGFDLRTQLEALEGLGLKEKGRGKSIDLRRAAGYLGGLVLVVVAFGQLRRRWRARREAPRADATVLYERALAHLAKQGFEREPAESATRFAERLSGGGHAASSAFAELAEHYEAARFGRADASAQHLRSLERALAEVLRS